MMSTGQTEMPLNTQHAKPIKLQTVQKSEAFVFETDIPDIFKDHVSHQNVPESATSVGSGLDTSRMIKNTGKLSTEYMAFLQSFMLTE